MDALLVAAFGLTPAIAWGVSDFFYARGSQKFGSLKTALAVNSAGALIYCLAYLLFLQGDATYSSEGVVYALIGSLSFGLAQTMFSRSLEIGPVSLASPISSTYPLVAVVVGLLLFGSTISFWQVVGIVMIVAGVMIASGILQLKRSERRLGKGPLFALGAATGWGFGFGFIAHAMTVMSWQGVFLIEVLVAPLVLVAVIAAAKSQENVSLAAIGKTLHSPFIWIAGVIQMVGLLVLNLGLVKFEGSGVVIVAISSCYPALTVLLALRHLKEKVPLVPLLGGGAGVLGVVVLSLGSA